VYAFNGLSGQLFTLDVTTGNATSVSNVDPAAGLVLGASPTPELGSIALAGLGLAAVAIYKRRTRHL
jgi:hypothetical protein